MLNKLIWLLGSLVLVTALLYKIFFSGRADDGRSISSQDIVPPESTGTPYNVCDRYSSIEYLSYSSASSFEKPNNIFGLYIYAEEERFFKLADKLVNSNGGDWGYVLLPYNVKDSDYAKWRRVFRDLNDRHLIPIIQLWDINPKDYKTDTKEAADFLNQFPWPVKERYVSVYNEPNDDRFWKGDANAKNYARVLDYTIDTFKRENSNFFMLNGALNSSASEGNGYINTVSFLYQMNQEIPGVFDKLDGWASHSYPQPNFAGSPYDNGFWSIKAYDSELKYLKSLGLKKELPVFITETGWAHAEGQNYNGSYLNAKQAAENIRIAFEEVWLKDGRIRAVTPFTVIYNPPHDHFSWINTDGVPYEQYEVLKKVKKITGEPSVLEPTTVRISNCQN